MRKTVMIALAAGVVGASVAEPRSGWAGCGNCWAGAGIAFGYGYPSFSYPTKYSRYGYPSYGWGFGYPAAAIYVPYAHGGYAAARPVANYGYYRPRDWGPNYYGPRRFGAYGYGYGYGRPWGYGW